MQAAMQGLQGLQRLQERLQELPQGQRLQETMQEGLQKNLQENQEVIIFSQIGATDLLSVAFFAFLNSSIAALSPRACPQDGELITPSLFGGRIPLFPAVPEIHRNRTYVEVPSQKQDFQMLNFEIKEQNMMAASGKSCTFAPV